ncbi:MAG: alpha/beta hydrolase [Gammaproteobacteria bacterium]|nr:alpha/beta hydrolase [Gammaproteobacteria bacterium]
MEVPGAYRPRRKPQSLDLEIRGLSMRVHSWGDEAGRPVILLHGWGDCGATWQFLVDELPQDWRLLAPDWRGFGDSAWGHGAYWFPDYLADLDALLDALYPDQRVDLVGHSMGGNVAGLYAGARPERVRRIVSLEGFGLKDVPPDQAPHRYRQWLDDVKAPQPFQTYADHAALARRLMRRNPHLGEGQALFVAAHWTGEDSEGRFVIKTDPAHRWVNPVLYRRAEAQACWAAIEAPVLFLLARESHFYTEEGARFIDADFGRAHFRDLREMWLEDCGHMLHWERPAAVADLVVEFLAP